MGLPPGAAHRSWLAPLFRSTVDTLFRREFYRALETMILAGSGTDPESRGILNTTGIGSVSAGTGAGSKVAAAGSLRARENRV